MGQDLVIEERHLRLEGTYILDLVLVTSLVLVQQKDLDKQSSLSIIGITTPTL
jgi:hypothetical protein